MTGVQTCALPILKLFADNRRHTKHIGLQTGGGVLVKAARKDELSPFYDPQAVSRNQNKWDNDFRKARVSLNYS